MTAEYRIGDPVVDLAQGRPMIVLETPDETVAEWTDREGYDLAGNYANAKLGAEADEPVVVCVYVSDIRSEPSKSYTFPASRLALIDAHHADDGRRVYDRIARDVLERLFVDLRPEVDSGDAPDAVLEWLDVAAGRQFGDDLADEALELADVEQRFGGDDGA